MRDTETPTLQELKRRLARAEARIDRAESDAEYLAARQIYIAARADVERAQDRRAVH